MQQVRALAPLSSFLPLGLRPRGQVPELQQGLPPLPLFPPLEQVQLELSVRVLRLLVQLSLFLPLEPVRALALLPLLPLSVLVLRQQALQLLHLRPQCHHQNEMYILDHQQPRALELPPLPLFPVLPDQPLVQWEQALVPRGRVLELRCGQALVLRPLLQALSIADAYAVWRLRLAVLALLNRLLLLLLVNQLSLQVSDLLMRYWFFLKNLRQPIHHYQIRFVCAYQ